VLGALKAGAAGYLLKTVSLAKLIDAIRLIYAGEAVFDLGATRHALAGVLSSHHMGQGATKSELLHNRELQLLRLVGRGLRNKQVADQLGISERTVQTHLLNIFRRLGVNSRTEAVVRAVRDGMITFDELS
jgi:DNA-binding NarL/FixJ family response regulator